MSLTGTLVDRLEDVDEHIEEWERLATVAGRPYCTPGWGSPGGATRPPTAPG